MEMPGFDFFLVLEVFACGPFDFCQPQFSHLLNGSNINTLLRHFIHTGTDHLT